MKIGIGTSKPIALKKNKHGVLVPIHCHQLKAEENGVERVSRFDSAGFIYEINCN